MYNVRLVKVGELAKSLTFKWKALVRAYSPPRVEEVLSVVSLDLVANHSQESSDPDPDLFVAADGRPMTFTMSDKDQEAFKVTMNAENAMWQI